MNRILVDTENNNGKCKWNELPADSVIILFISDRTKEVGNIIKYLGNNWKVEVIYVYSSGKNAMDHSICEYIWKDSVKTGLFDQYIIISNDCDFDKEIESMNRSGIRATRDPLTSTESSENQSETDSMITPTSLKISVPKAMVKILEETPLTREEMAHPIRSLGKIKREECRRVLASKGIPLSVAKQICKSMNPQTAQMVITGKYNTDSDYKRVQLRVSTRLSNLGYSDGKIEEMKENIFKDIEIME